MAAFMAAANVGGDAAAAAASMAAAVMSTPGAAKEAGKGNFSFTDFFLAYMCSQQQVYRYLVSVQRSSLHSTRMHEDLSTCAHSILRCLRARSPKSRHISLSLCLQDTQGASTAHNIAAQLAQQHQNAAKRTAAPGVSEEEKQAVDPRKYKTRMCRNWETKGICRKKRD